MIRRTAALAALVLGATIVVAPAASAAPGDPNQVALVVDYPGGASRTFCVTYHSGMGGTDVLAAAGPSYGTGPYAGFVLKIGGQGTTPPNDDDYWSYWRSSGSGTFSYSSSGVGSTTPAAGSVERWIWAPTSTASFQDRSYASLCPGGYAPTPAPSSAAPAPSGVAAPTGSAGGNTSGPVGAGTGSTSAHGTSPTAGTTAATGSPAPTGPTAPTTASAAATSTAATSTGAPTRPTSVTASTVAAADDGLGTGPTVGLIVAAVAVMGFGALTVVARRRRGERD